VQLIDALDMQSDHLSLRGKGAFGRFHTAIQAYEIQDQWYEYQKDRLREIAVEWCHQNRLTHK
jgi:hypothetical protein